MQQYREGQRLQGSDGKVYVVRNGMPASEAPNSAFGPAIGNDPRIPGALQGQGLQNTRTQQQINQFPLDVANTRTNIAQGQNSINQSRIGNVQELRKEFNALPEVKSYSEYLTQMSKAVRAPDTPQGDLNVIYAYAKAMDPGSVVREGEMDMANSTSSFVQDVARRYGKIAEGNRLPPAVRRGLVEGIRSAGHGFADSYAQRYRQYRDQAQAIGADPKQVVGNHMGDAFRQIEENYIRDAGGKAENAAPGISFDSSGVAIKQDHGGGSLDMDAGIIGEEGGFHTVQRPGYEGVNAQINAMLKAGRPIGEIATLLQNRGAAPQEAADLIQQAQTIKRWQAKNPGYKGDFRIDVERGQVPNSAFQNFVNSDVGTGAALGVNALTAGIPGALAGQQPNIDLARQAHPMSSLGGETLGAVGGTLLANKGLGAGARALENVPYLRGPASFLANSPGKQMLAADMGYGATYGATQNPGNPGKGALIGSLAALGGNVAGRGAAAGLRGAGDRLGYGAAALPAGESMIASQALKANPQDVLGRLNEASSLGMPLTLADAAPQLRSLGGSVVRKSPDAYAFAREAIGSRPAGQADRLNTLIGDQLAPPGAIGDIVDSSLKRARAGSKDLYGKAMEQSSPDDAALNEILRAPAMGKAARDAYDVALNKGEKPGDLSFETDAITGEPRITGNPNWRTLQYMKFELDKAASRDPGLRTLQRRFNTQLSKLNPDFRSANKAYGNVAKQGSTAQAGYDAAAPGISPANLGLPKDNLPHFQQGYASRMADTAGKMRLSGDPYNAVYGSPWQQQKLGMVFPEGAPNFAKARGIETEMGLTNKELFGGSPTQPRAEADKMFDAGGIADFAQDALSLASGAPPINVMRSKLFAGRGLFGAAADKMRLGFGKSAQQKADQMAPVLFNTNPKEVSAQLAEMIRQQALRDAYVQRTGMFGSAIGAPSAITLSNR